MKRLIVASLFPLLMLTACVVTPANPEYGGGVVVSPLPLPPIVVLGVEPYYEQRGFFYYYHDNSWSYSRSRRGPWKDLPRSHWPRETRRSDEYYRRDRDRHMDYDRR